MFVTLCSVSGGQYSAEFAFTGSFDPSLENPTWSAPRIHGELLMLRFEVSERTISRWMMKKLNRELRNWERIYNTVALIRPSAT